MGFQNAQLSTIVDIQRDYRLQIPEYQRGYAWGNKQWLELWDDLNNVTLRAKGDHFGGVLMFRALHELKNGKETVEVVDGQQRLITVSILLHTLALTPISIDFKDNEQSQTYFDYFVCGKSELAPRLSQFVSFYGKNMEQAAEFFNTKVNTLDSSARKQLTNALLNRFKLFILSIQPGFDVHVAFETINSRGKKLTLLETLKNRLIYLSSTAKNQASGRIAASAIHKSWKNIYHWLGKGTILLNDDDFLRAHSTGWFQYKKEALWLENQLFDDAFSTKPNGISPQGIIDYVRSLEIAAAWWFHLNHPIGMPPKVQQKLQSLNRVSFSTVRPILLWSLVKLGEGDNLLVTEPAKNLGWSKSFELLVEQAERFAVTILMANDRKSNFSQPNLNWSAYWLAHTDEPFDEDPNSAPPAPTNSDAAVIFVGDFLRSLIDPQEQNDTFNDVRFPWAGSFSSAALKEVVADQFRAKKGFYGWDFGKIIIYEWEQYLRGSKGKVEKRPWEKFSWDDSVEHIYPQKPDSNEWKPAITFDGRTSPAVEKAVLHSLGNLLLLSKSLNASYSNLPYKGGVDPEKAKYYRFREGGTYSELQVAKVCQVWNILAIAARGIAMMRRAEMQWGFQVVGPTEKLTEWLPFLFGDQAKSIKEGNGSNGRKLTETKLRNLVKLFESP